MKQSAPAAVLWMVLLGAAMSASADGGGTRERRVEKSDVRTRAKNVEVRERHRVKSEKHTVRENNSDESAHHDHDHSGNDGDSRKGSNRGPG